MKLKFVLYCTALFCTVVSLSRAGTWDTLYTRQTNMDVGNVLFAPDDSFVLVTGLDNTTGASVTRFYRPSDGMFLDEQPFYFNSFSYNGKYALVNKYGTKQLVDWKNNWQVIVEFEKDMNIHEHHFLYDNKSVVGLRGNGYALWDGETGKIRRDIQLHEDTIVSGSGQNRVVKTYGIKSVALLADGKTLCVSEVVEVYNYGIQKKVSEEYIGEVIDIETGERKAVAKDIYRFIAIPGSNDVIGAGKRDSTKSYFDTYYMYDGYSLQKKFMYPTPNIYNIKFNQSGDYFLLGSAPGPLQMIETKTGIIKSYSPNASKANAISNSKNYFAICGSVLLAMYETNNIFTSNVLFGDSNTNNTAPQPSKGILRITIKELLPELPINTKVFDVNGRDLSIILPIISQQEGSIILDVSSLPNGQYTLTLQQVDKVFSYPFILTK
ncbi:MAG: T9SS type A sorting domain-containing protein [Bacteriodetes bacterium]|nr:T9SS type A sorting domain-containing protein [Bacteroidota bacterium]